MSATMHVAPSSVTALSISAPRKAVRMPCRFASKDFVLPTRCSANNSINALQATVIIQACLVVVQMPSTNPKAPRNSGSWRASSPSDQFVYKQLVQLLKWNKEMADLRRAPRAPTRGNSSAQETWSLI